MNVIIANLTSANGAAASIANISIATIETPWMKSQLTTIANLHTFWTKNVTISVILPLFSNERHRSSAMSGSSGFPAHTTAKAPSYQCQLTRRSLRRTVPLLQEKARLERCLSRTRALL